MVIYVKSKMCSMIHKMNPCSRYLVKIIKSRCLNSIKYKKLPCKAYWNGNALQMLAVIIVTHTKFSMKLESGYFGNHGYLLKNQKTLKKLF